MEKQLLEPTIKKRDDWRYRGVNIHIISIDSIKLFPKIFQMKYFALSQKKDQSVCDYKISFD